MCTIYDVLSHLMLFCCRGRGLLSFVAIYALLRGETLSPKVEKNEIQFEQVC